MLRLLVLDLWTWNLVGALRVLSSARRRSPLLPFGLYGVLVNAGVDAAAFSHAAFHVPSSLHCLDMRDLLFHLPARQSMFWRQPGR